MARRASVPLVCLSLLAVVLAGCADDADPAAPQFNPPTGVLRVLDGDGEPIAYAQATALANDTVVAVASADAHGNLTLLPLIGPGVTHIAVGAPGFKAETFSVLEAPVALLLAKTTEAAVGAFLRFLPSVDLRCPAIDPPPYSCGRFGEPVVEVAGDGAIWASATCCIGESPPIWVSRDGGASFQQLHGEGTGLVRDATGIEGDFAIDDAGNVYFFDILAAAAWFTSYEADGTHRWTLPMAFPPLVDRPWVRAGKADEVFILYNTGSSSIFYRSTDGGKTWDLGGSKEFPCSLGNIGQGPTRDQLYVAASCASEPMLWTSKNGGRSWDDGRKVPLPPGDYDSRGVESHPAPVADEAGNVYVPIVQTLRTQAEDPDRASSERGVWLARMSPSGSWSGPFLVAASGQNEYVWPAAGKAGHVALAWYHAEGLKDGVSSEWRLMTAASVDADKGQPHFQIAIADPEVLHTGPLVRNLGDFLEADMTPDGRFVVVYGKNLNDGGLTPGSPGQNVLNRFVQSDGGLDLGPLEFLNGP